MPDEFAIDETLRPHIIDAWRCNVCNRVWEDKRNARECCERLAATHLYRCPKCSDTYELGAPRSFEQHLKECDIEPFPRSPILECEVCDDGACLNCESPAPHPYPCPAAIRKYSPDPAPPGTTLAVIDELRACIELTDDEDLVATLETAVSHLEDLAAKLTSAEADIDRLYLQAESGMANLTNLNAVAAWLDLARSLQAGGGQMLTPAGLLQAYPGTLLSIHPQPRKREETPTHE